MEHHHEHEHRSEYNAPVSIARHEGALICSMRIRPHMSYDETVRETSVSLKRLSEAAEIDGGCVGHIKASVNHEDRASILSATENYVNVREIDIDRCELSVVAVVFPKDEERFVEEFKKIAKNLDWNKDGCIGENSL